MENKIHFSFIDLTAYLLMILCFPLNPLVYLDLIEPLEIKIFLFIGFFIWIIGMIFVIYPFIYFKRKGKVPKGKSYVNTNKLVTTGLYSIVRHVQYTGGVISIFIATPFLYPHWLFIILGVPGILLTYLGTKREDKILIKKFGNNYLKYAKKVPSMNVFVGIYRKLKKITKTSGRH